MRVPGPPGGRKALRPPRCDKLIQCLGEPSEDRLGFSRMGLPPFHGLPAALEVDPGAFALGLRLRQALLARTPLRPSRFQGTVSGLELLV